MLRCKTWSAAIAMIAAFATFASGSSDGFDGECLGLGEAYGSVLGSYVQSDMQFA